jgi:uncharacterized phage protein (TIGR01671 family)
MRQIKFRVFWNGSLWNQDQIGSIRYSDGKIYEIHLNHEHGDNSWNGDTWTRSDDFVLEQFTGLLDKNGKEIYEGDIIRSGDNEICDVVVEFGDTYDFDSENGYYGWFGRYINNDGCCQINQSIKYTSEVIGNIHENPDLLEVKK